LYRFVPPSDSFRDYALNPPSIVGLAPVTNPASGPARYATSAAISSAVPYRGTAITFLSVSASGPVAGRRNKDRTEEYLFDPGEKEDLLAKRTRGDATRLQELLAAWARDVRPAR
jgi:hypothetical protein